MRKMWLIFTGLLVILFITGQSSAQAGISLTAINTILTWGSTIIFTDLALIDDTSENIGKLFVKVDEISSALKYSGIQMDIKLDTMLNTLLNDFELTMGLQDLKTQLLHHLETVDHYHGNSLKYTPGRYDREALQGFVNNVLYGDENLPRILVQIHNIFSPDEHRYFSKGFLSRIIEKTELNLPTECQQHNTPHQLMYYIYVQLIIAEMKSLATFKKVYALKSWLKNSTSHFKSDLQEAFINFETGVREFHQLFTKQLTRLPRHLRQCHVNAPRPGVDFVELERLSRIKLFKPDFREHLRCDCCTYPQASYTENGIQMKAHNCKPLSRIVRACPAWNGRSNDYSWWKDDSGTYGGAKSCSQPETFNAASVVTTAAMFVALPYSRECNNWYCSADEKIKQGKKSHSWRISVKPQISDIRNDMVVTGVQFIVKGKTIHLQIQQGKFSDNALVYKDIAWKDVDMHYNVSRTTRLNQLDARIGSNKKTIYLDDITVPQGSVVTGIWLRRIRRHSYFKLWVHATGFDFTTGKLRPSSNLWCSRYHCRSTIPTGDYVRNRIEIDMAAADNPTRGSGFNYDPQTNKMIKFTHTDAHKDAGQTTIPFIDLQPVQVQPAFPLSGVGLYYRGKDGFGGYIAPRIYTLDVGKHMKTSYSGSY